jgi:hypothetical protein
VCSRKVALQDLRTSSVSNIRWPMASSIFRCVALFKNLRTLQLSVREDLLAGDEVYAAQDSAESAHAFARCLMSAPNLKSLDLEICSTGENSFNSYVLHT